VRLVFRHAKNRLTATALLGLLLTFARVGSAQKNDWLIVPGQRVGPITAKTTRGSLDALFGNENVQDRNLELSEAPDVATVIYGGDSSAALAVTWDKERVSTIHICYGTNTGTCRWRTASGIRIGLPVRELEKLNGKSFQIAGYFLASRDAGRRPRRLRTLAGPTDSSSGVGGQNAVEAGIEFDETITGRQVVLVG